MNELNEALEPQYKNRALILLNVVLLTFMSCLDSSIVNVALPVMADQFSVSMSSISAVVTSYLVAISATILIFGRLGDIKGKVKIFKFGIVIFTVGSLLCAISNSLYLLVAARGVQAIGAAAFMATSQGIITRVFPANKRGRALGIVGSFVALGTLVGPPLGGFIVNIVSWRYIFIINIPIGIFAFIMGFKILPKDTDCSNEKLDLKGSILFIISITTLFGALLIGEHIGFTNIFIVAGFIIALLTFIIFLLVEKRTKIPLLELNLFKNTLFALSIFCTFISFIAISCSNIIQPFYFQDILKMSPAVAGMFMMTYPLVLVVVAPLSGYLSDKIGSEALTCVGLMLSSTGLLLMSTLDVQSSPIYIVIFIAIMALGNGMFQSPNTSLIMSTVPTNRLGIAGSINALIRNLGMVVGVSMSTLLLFRVMSSKLGYTVTTFVKGEENAFVGGMQVVYITAAIICMVGAILTAIRLYKRKKG